MGEESSGETLSAGQLARHAGVSADTLRHYERKGVIARPPRAANGYRRYPQETLARVQLIRRALGVGFTLDELARVLRMRDRGGAPCTQVRAFAANKLDQIEERLRELVALRNELRATLRAWDTELAKTPTGTRARLLESLAKNSGTPCARRAAPFSTTNNRKKNKQ